MKVIGKIELPIINGIGLEVSWRSYSSTYEHYGKRSNPFSCRSFMRPLIQTLNQDHKGSRTLQFDSNPMMVRKLILIKYLSRSE